MFSFVCCNLMYFINKKKIKKYHNPSPQSHSTIKPFINSLVISRVSLPIYIDPPTEIRRYFYGKRYFLGDPIFPIFLKVYSIFMLDFYTF